jgi:CcmD family protein
MQRNAVAELLRKRQRRQAMKEGLSFVMGVNLIIWFGIAFYLFILDRKIRKLEKTQTTQDT